MIVDVASLQQKCNETDVGLVDGLIPGEGKVKICINGTWNSVCSRSWDISDATVVCQQLGYDECKYTLLLVSLLLYSIPIYTSIFSKAAPFFFVKWDTILLSYG